MSTIMNMFENSCCLSMYIDGKRTNVWIIIYIHRESNWEIRQPVRYIHGFTTYRCEYIAFYFVYYVGDGFFFLNYIFFSFEVTVKWKPQKIYIYIPTHPNVWLAFRHLNLNLNSKNKCLTVKVKLFIWILAMYFQVPVTAVGRCQKIFVYGWKNYFK